MDKKVREESFDEESSSYDNPQNGDSCVEFNGQLKSKQHETLRSNLAKLELKEGILNTGYSHEAGLTVARNLRNESTFSEALLTVKTWLERGECTEQTASNFYSLIQGINDHLSYLLQKVEYYKYERDKKESDLICFSQYSRGMFDAIKTVLNLAEQQQVQNFFTEIEKNDIKKSVEALKASGILSEHGELQLELKKLIHEKNMYCSQLSALQEQKKVLTSQLAASSEECKRLEMITQYISSSDVNYPNVGIQKQAQLIAIISPFLYGHGDVGQSTAVILSYLKHLGFQISEKEVEDILTRYPSVFKKNVSKKGISVEERWIFCAHQL